MTPWKSLDSSFPFEAHSLAERPDQSKIEPKKRTTNKQVQCISDRRRKEVPASKSLRDCVESLPDHLNKKQRRKKDL